MYESNKKRPLMAVFILKSVNNYIKKEKPCFIRFLSGYHDVFLHNLCI